MPTINAADVRCPKCAGPVWDERPSKKNAKGPDFKCKDVNCKDEKGFKTGIWERDLAKSGAAPVVNNAKQAYTAGASLPGDDQETGAAPDAAAGTKYASLDKLLSVYDVFWDHCVRLAKKDLGADASHEGIAAQTATLLIAAKDLGLAR